MKDYPIYYEVSNTGKVKSKSRVIWNSRGNGFYQNIKEKILKHCISDNKKGYPMVILCFDKKRLNMAIHILVYTMFVGEIPKGMTINHKDGNHENNQLNNLELATYSENMQHSYDILKRTSDKPKYKYIIQNTITCEKVLFNSSSIASNYLGVCPQTIRSYSNGTLKGIFQNTYKITREPIQNLKESKIYE